MKPTYIGTKMIRATPMTRGDYNSLRGWDMPAGEDAADDGFLVEYQDGHISWSPKATFDDTYRPTAGMPFGLALEALKRGQRVQRAGWNGKGMYVFMRYGSVNGEVAERSSHIDGVSQMLFYRSDAHGTTQLPYLCMRTASGAVVNGWLASQSDMLADDWGIFEGAVVVA